MSNLKSLVKKEGGRLSTTPSTSAKNIYKQNSGDMRKADKIIFDQRNFPNTLTEALEAGGGQFSRAEKELIKSRPDLRKKLISSISRLQMKIKDAYVSINNLDIKESTRRFAPTWSYIFVNKQLYIVAVEKFKKDLSYTEEKKMANKYKDCILIIARASDFSSVAELEESINSCKVTFDYIRKKP